MSKVNGQLVMCDRCGMSEFVKTIGDGELDGGFTRWNKFEPLSVGWGKFDHRDLCPKCNAEYQTILRNFESTFVGGAEE